MLKLPRFIEADGRRGAVEAALARDLRPLWPGGTLAVPHVGFGEPLVAALAEAQNKRQLQRGLEHIEDVLRREQKGLDALSAKQGVPAANRASRLLVIADDGAERFYRQCETLLLRHAERLLGLRVAVPSTGLAERLFAADALVKVVLVSDRDAVTGALLALA